MKATIQLTDEQIEILIKNEKEFLIKEKEKELTEIEKKYDALIEKLSLKYKNYTIKIDEEPIKKETKRAKLDIETIKKMFAEKRSLAEIASHFGTSTQSIRSKLWHHGIKITDLK